MAGVAAEIDEIEEILETANVDPEIIDQVVGIVEELLLRVAPGESRSAHFSANLERMVSHRRENLEN